MHAVNWLLGIEEPNDYDKSIGNELARAFVTRQEFENILIENQYLQWRVEALEKTVEKVASEAYCKAKIEMMFEYNFTSIECGNKTYFRVNPEHYQGNNVIMIEPMP